MISDTIEKKDFFASLGKASTELFDLVSSTNEKRINTVPFKDSWTVAQLADHVTKSNKAIAQALGMDGHTVERNPEERVKELRSMFLNFNTKFQAPEFIRPKNGGYKKEVLINDLKKSSRQVKDSGESTNLSEIISLPAFGEITKLELLHFVLYHTIRHTHQLKNILNVLQKDERKSG